MTNALLPAAAVALADTDAGCAHWALLGECAKNKRFVDASCAKSWAAQLRRSRRPACAGGLFPTGAAPCVCVG